VIEIEFRPLRGDEFIGAYKGLGQQLQGKTGLLVASFVIGGDGAQEAGQFFGPNCGLMFLHMRCECAAQIRRKIACAAPGCNSISKHLPAHLQNTVSKVI
jgi:hypothetical protein